VESIKPEAKIYDKAEKASGVKPDEILLVDDSRTNLMAAKQLGWHVLWFDDYHPEDSEARIKQMLEF
jgi:HAD superfamily hydrolase (TIGR01509 family)